MMIVLCSKRHEILERWRSILAGDEFSLREAASMEQLQSTVAGSRQLLLLVHRAFAADCQTLAGLCAGRENCRIFVLADQPDRREEIELLQLGIVGYANTYITPQRLVEAVKTVKEGRVWFEYELISLLIQAATGKEKRGEAVAGQLPAGLSQREREIALLVAEGLTNQAIGERLFISERTVKSHLSSIFSKTGTASRLQLALLLRK